MQLNISFNYLIGFVWIVQVFSKTTENLPQSRIAGGNIANRNQFPYQISIHGNGILCGGTIISKDYILTAAHCVMSGGKVFSPSSITIRAGTTHVNAGGVVVGVSEVKPHPSYGNFNYDIATLKLAKSLKFNDSIKPIRLAMQNPPAGAAVVISGWGLMYNGSPIPKILQYNTLKALSIDECKRLLNPLPSTVICFGHTAGNGVCGGDSGGPATYNNELVGVANFNVGGCGSSIPDGFASVAYLIQWIKDNSDV